MQRGANGRWVCLAWSPISLTNAVLDLSSSGQAQACVFSCSRTFTQVTAAGATRLKHCLCLTSDALESSEAAQPSTIEPAEMWALKFLFLSSGADKRLFNQCTLNLFRCACDYVLYLYCSVFQLHWLSRLSSEHASAGPAADYVYSCNADNAFPPNFNDSHSGSRG